MPFSYLSDGYDLLKCRFCWEPFFATFHHTYVTWWFKLQNACVSFFRVSPRFRFSILTFVCNQVFVRLLYISWWILRMRLHKMTISMCYAVLYLGHFYFGHIFWKIRQRIKVAWAGPEYAARGLCFIIEWLHV